MAKIDDWNTKWDAFMDAVRALQALVENLKGQVDPETKAAFEEAQKDVAAGAVEVSEFMKANVVSGA